MKKETFKQPNVLLLYMDDLRPELNSYGDNLIKSPNIDELAKNGVKFTEAYANVAVCGASRASMLTGMLPTKDRFLNYNTFVEKETPDAITLPQLFKNNGYTTISNGKIYHHLDDRTEDWDEVWRPYAFEENEENLAPTDHWQSLWKDYQKPENAKTYKETGNGPAYEIAKVADTAYIDGLMAKKVIQDIEKLSTSKKPFFLTAGFISNHLPFNAPKKYWDLYPAESIKQPYNNFVPENAPKISISNWGELRSYQGIPKNGQVSDSLAKTLIRGYYSTVSYVYAQIGKIVASLKKKNLYDNTIIVLVGDHGYNLQEHSQWAKFTSHRISDRVPLLISAPQLRKSQTSEALIQLVDVYPTLAELCQLEMPKNQLDGKSLVENLKEPSIKINNHILMKNHTGFTIKTKRYAYTEYLNPEDNSLTSKMLFDHQEDPDENVNVANDPTYAAAVKRLHGLLHQKYKSNILGSAER